MEVRMTEKRTTASRSRFRAKMPKIAIFDIGSARVVGHLAATSRRWHNLTKFGQHPENRIEGMKKGEKTWAEDDMKTTLTDKRKRVRWANVLCNE